MQVSTPSALAAVLRARRRELNFTQQELAEALGLTRQSVTRMETGRTLPDFVQLLRLLDVLDLRLDIRTADGNQDEDRTKLATPSRSSSPGRGDMGIDGPADLDALERYVRGER